MAGFQGIGGIVAYLLFFGVIMYLFILRPQKKRDQKNKEMLNALQVGSNVTTIGGVVGKIVNIKDDELVVETSIEKTQIKLKRWAIKEIEKPVEA